MKKLQLKNHYLINKLKSNLEAFPDLKENDRVLVSVSAGVDSVALLVLLNELDLFQLITVHINHKLRHESDFDEQFVRDISRDLNIPFRSKSLDPKNKLRKQSVEEWGRKERYSFLKNTLIKDKGHWIMTAHHANDQAETILMNLTRKSGIAGLRGISKEKDKVLRPLLNFTKTEILNFSKETDLPYQQDETNNDNSIPRNFLRNKILDTWEDQFPEVIQGISRSSNLLCEWSDGLDYMISEFIISGLKVRGKKTLISYNLFKTTPSIVKIRLIQLITDSSNNQWSKHQMSMLLQFLDKSKSGDFYKLSNGCRLLRDRNSIKVQSPLKHVNDKSVILRRNSPTNFKNYRYELNLQNNFKNKNHNKNYEIVDWEKLKNTTLKLRLWKKGDVFQPLGMKGHQKISDFLINQKVDCFDKELQSVLTADGKIVWVCGKRISNWVRITRNTNQIAVLSRNMVQ